MLQNIAVNLESWTVQTKQETAIYHTLNKLSVDTSRKVRPKSPTCPLHNRVRLCLHIAEPAKMQQCIVSVLLRYCIKVV